MKKVVRYSNEYIFLSGPSTEFNFLNWLRSNLYFQQRYLDNAKKIVKKLDYGVVVPSNEKKIISFADITFGSEMIDCDFLHLSKAYRIRAQYDNCSYYDQLRKIHSEKSVWQYDLDLWHLSEIISKQLENPNEKILKSSNSFYLRANNGGIIKIRVCFQPKTNKRFTESFFEIFCPEFIDDGDLSGRLFFGCGYVN